MIEIIILLALLALNTAISSWNAWVAGRAWLEAKADGGWSHALVWCAAIMSACGFTWIYSTVLTMGLWGFGIIGSDVASLVFDFAYLAIIFPILGTGLIMTIHSWQVATRTRRWQDYGIAGYNTFAQVYNTINALSAVPKALEGIGKAVAGSGSGEDAKGKGLLLAAFITILAIIAGILTTRAIMLWSARSYAPSLINRARESVA